ncbi:hypothetical protein M6D93_04925 [Jatrophihabitans telluris]|uniref:YkuD domain-containing protein n=1 Tax=Jatrophihabitans telluris TaxID=2038343 RepID=A0ABY4R0M7_9ACTN|nr:hypothetical protein [Jatrophihabitans telluris]UQX89348.1 hypothetical protein M6D93_04925 [Jatrophihabitans telluris]
MRIAPASNLSLRQRLSVLGSVAALLASVVTVSTVTLLGSATPASFAPIVTSAMAPAALTRAAASSHAQVITVESSSASATRAKLDLWQKRTNGTYLHVWGPVTAFVGELGIGETRDDVARTPAGVFALTQAFGSNPSNGTKLPYLTTTRQDWWDGYAKSPTYNQHVHSATSPGPGSENLYDAGYVYSRAVVIDYNTNPVVKGAGAAFFLHVTNKQPTAGCVAIAAGLLDTVMRWLNPASHPVISIGVGAAARSIITNNDRAVAAHNPFGYLDTAISTARSRLTVRGWAADPDTRSAALRIHLYVDGRGVASFGTGVSRPDAARARGVGPNQGYAATVTIPTGSHQACVFAINVGAGSGNTLLACKKVTVR